MKTCTTLILLILDYVDQSLKIQALKGFLVHFLILLQRCCIGKVYYKIRYLFFWN
ncbi:hypothetical protein C2G38_2068588, partial [Gigaspora rosea]